MSVKFNKETETENLESLSKEFASLIKQSNRNKIKTKLKLLSHKNKDDYITNYIPPIRKVEKINSHFNFQKEPPVKMKLKKYNEDNQNKKFEFKNLNNYFKVFQKEEKNFYKEDYMRRMFNLLNKKDKMYSHKRKLLGDTNIKKISTDLPPKIATEYNRNRLDSLKSYKIKNFFSETPKKKDSFKHTIENVLTLKEVYDSEFSISESSLNDSHKNELLLNLNTEYNFIDPSLNSRQIFNSQNNFKISESTKNKPNKNSIRVETLNTMSNQDQNKNRFFLTQFPKTRTKKKVLSLNKNPPQNGREKKLKLLEDQRTAKILSLLDSFKM